MPVTTAQVQPQLAPAPAPVSPELEKAKENVAGTRKKLKCLNWTLVIYGMIGVMQGAVFSVVCRKCAQGYIRRGAEANNIPYDANVVSRDEYVLHESFKNVAMFMFFYSMIIAMKGKAGLWGIWRSSPDSIAQQRKCGIMTTAVMTLFICAVGYQFCGTHDIMTKYKHHCQSKWGSWGKKPVEEEGPSVEDYENATKRTLQEAGEHHGHHGHHGEHGHHGHHGEHGHHGHHGEHGHHGHHGHHDKREHRGPPTSVKISLSILYLVLIAQFYLMGCLKKGLEDVKRLTPEEPKEEAPKVEQAPVIVVTQPTVEIREEPTLIAKSNNNMV